MDFETFGKRMRKFGKDTVTEVQKMNEIRQMNARISEQKRQMEAVYSLMGEKLHRLYKESPLEGFETEFQELEERLEAIETYQDQIRAIKGIRVCPECRTEVSVTERYCSACGQKLPEILRIEEDEDGKTIIEGTGSEVLEAEVVSGEVCEAECAEAEAAEVSDAVETEAAEVSDTVEAEASEAGSSTEEEAADVSSTAEESAEPECVCGCEDACEEENTDTEHAEPECACGCEDVCEEENADTEHEESECACGCTEENEAERTDAE